jgi:hypothetical protein
MAGTHYVGKAGHLAVMGEIAWRGYNVAMPEIDIGDDVFVYRDSTNQTWRLQVKTSRLYKQKKSRAYQFLVRETQITTPANPPLHFVFCMRLDPGWQFLVIDRAIFANYRSANTGFGSRNVSKTGIASVTFNVTQHIDGPKKGRVICSKTDLTHHLNNWSTWPAI